MRPRAARVLLFAALSLVGTAFAQGSSTSVASAEALVAAVAEGGLVTVEPGEYVLPETLVVNTDVQVRGFASGEATLFLRGAPLGLRVVDGAHAHLVGLRLAYDADAPGDVAWVHDARLTLDDVAIGLAVGDPDAADGGEAFGRGLVLTGDAQADVLGGGLGRNEGAAIEVRDTSRVNVERALLSGNASGVVVVNEARVTMTATELYDNLDFALSVRGRAQVTGSGNLFVFNGVAEGDRLISAVFVGDEAQLHLEGGDVFVDHPGGAFEVAGAAQVTLCDVTVEDTGTWAHTYLVEQATLTVHGGRFDGNEGGFYAGEGSRVALHDVAITRGASDAIFADGHALVEVFGGRIEDHAEFGLSLVGYARGHVEGASLARNRSGLVAMGAATLIVRESEVTDHERTGVAYLDAALGSASGNRLTGNGGSGVVVAGEAVASVLGNELSANAQRGAWFDEAGSGRFEGNTVRGSPVGVEVAVEATPVFGANVFDDVGSEVVEAEVASTE